MHHLDALVQDVEGKKITVRPRPVFVWMAVAAGIIGTIGIIVQIVEIVRRRSSCDVSPVLPGALVIGQLIWLSYGIALQLIANIITGAVGLMIGLVALIVTLVYRRGCGRDGEKNAKVESGG